MYSADLALGFVSVFRGPVAPFRTGSLSALLLSVTAVRCTAVRDV